MTDETNFFWMVGLLEGEGSFLRPSPSKPREPKIDVEMKDEDVIKRVAALLGVSYRRRDRHRENTSVTFHVRLAGKRAATLMWRMRPYLSARRQAQIDRAVQCYADRGPQFHPANLPQYRFEPVCIHTLCAVLPIGDARRCPEHSGTPSIGGTAV